MQDCPDCRATVSEAERTCPSCGSVLPGGPDGLGAYRFEGLIYEGEHTTTYRARHRANDQPVAVVRFLESLSSDQVARLKEDAERVRSIRGPRVIRVHGFHETDRGEAYRVKELVDGEPLPALVRRGYFKTISNAVWLMIELTRAVEDIHAAGLLAPYTLPDDVLVSRPEHRGRRAVRVGYHGYRFLDPVKDRPGPSLRHLLEDHPDLKGETRITRLSDIHTLGRLFYEVVARERPGPDPVLDPALRLPAPLGTLIRSMLDPDPSRRPRSTGEVIAQLKKARRARPSPRAGEEASKNPGWKIGPLASLLVSVIALVAALAVWLSPSQDDGRLPGAVRDAKDAVVFIRSWYQVIDPDGVTCKPEPMYGTGILVDDRTILTARHVAAPWYEDFPELSEDERSRFRSFESGISLWFPGARPFPEEEGRKGEWDFSTGFDSRSKTKKRSVRLDWVSGHGSAFGDDLAALRLGEPVKVSTLAPVGRVEYDALREGHRLHFWSYRRGPAVFQSENLVKPSHAYGSLSSVSVKEKMLRVDATNFGGSSGGPILTRQGRLVGIALQSEGDQNDITIALDAPAIRRFLQAVCNGTAPIVRILGAGP